MCLIGLLLPGGNLGNTSAVGKALREMLELGLINKVPRIAVVQAAGANPFFTMFNDEAEKLTPMQPETFATAIRIGNPVSWGKATKIIKELQGLFLS